MFKKNLVLSITYIFLIHCVPPVVPVNYRKYQDPTYITQSSPAASSLKIYLSRSLKHFTLDRKLLPPVLSTAPLPQCQTQITTL